MGDARETEKDPDAFRTISEVAEDLNLPQHVLRFWETRFPQIKPVKRAGGRRFYRPEDVDLLRGIRQLLYREGYTIKGVQKILKEQGIRHVQDIGVERDVAVMRSAPAERPAPAQDGVILGGLLGLLPRRRNKGYDDPALDAVPRDVELPLPFPDAEADRDLDADRGEPVAPLPPRARTAAPRSGDRAEARVREALPRGGRFQDEPGYDAQAYEEQAYDERTYEERAYEERGYEEHIYEERGYEVRAHGERGYQDPYRERGLPAEPRLTERPRRDVLDDETADAPPRPAARRPSSPPPARRRAEAPDMDAPRPMAAAGPAPSFAPPRPERPEPVVRRRPTRGPAARVSTAPVPEDPLLPFMESEPPVAPAPAPLDERIRRLQAREAGPPEEYLPPKLRRRPAAPAEPRPPMPEYAPAPRAMAARMGPSAWPELARAEAAAAQDLAAWHEHLSPAPAEPARRHDEWREEEAAFAPDPDDGYAEDDSIAPADAGWSAPADDATEADAPPDAWAQDEEDWDCAPSAPEPPPAVFHVSAPVSARLGMGTLAAAGLAGTARRSPTPSREAAMSSPSASRHQPPAAPEPAVPPRAAAPQQRPQAAFSAPAAPLTEAPARRVGPLTGPIMDSLEDELPPVLPAASAGAGFAPSPSAMAGMGPWARPAHAVPPGAGGRAPAPEPPAGFWHGRAPFEAAAPAAPIDPYLPPHLRGEAQRPAGQGGVQPVLSRDDVHRLQAALYELGECRRLLREASEPKAETQEA